MFGVGGVPLDSYEPIYSTSLSEFPYIHETGKSRHLEYGDGQCHLTDHVLEEILCMLGTNFLASAS